MSKEGRKNMTKVLKKSVTFIGGMLVFALLFPLNTLFAEKLEEVKVQQQSKTKTEHEKECEQPLKFDEVKTYFTKFCADTDIKSNVLVHWNNLKAADMFSEEQTCKNFESLATLINQLTQINNASVLEKVDKINITVPATGYSGSVKFDKESKTLTIELNPEGYFSVSEYIYVFAEEIKNAVEPTP